MACTLYREGTGTVEHGIECESTTCEVEYLDSMLAAGWLPSPPGYEPPEAFALDDDEPEEGIEGIEGIEDAERIERESQIAINAGDAGREEVRAELQPIIDNLEAQIEKLDLINSNLEEQLAEAREEIRQRDERAAALASAMEEQAQEEEEQEEEPGDRTPEEVRQAAKDAGIDGWDTKRIATLVKMLEA